MNNEDRRREILREILENTTQDDMIIINYTEMFEAYKAAEVLIEHDIAKYVDVREKKTCLRLPNGKITVCDAYDIEFEGHNYTSDQINELMSIISSEQGIRRVSLGNT